MSYNTKILGALLERIFADTRDVVVSPDSVRACFVIGGEGTAIKMESATRTMQGTVAKGAGPTLTIVDDGYEALADFVEETLKDDELRQFVGKVAIHKQLISFVQSSQGKMPYGNPSDLVRDRILKPLRDAIRQWVCIVPIVNLVVKTPLDIGSATLVSNNSGMLQATRFVMDHGFAGSQTEQDTQRANVLCLVASINEYATSYAQVNVKAHPKHANAVALAEASNAINTLRAFTHTVYARDVRPRFGLPPEIQSGLWWSVALAEDPHHELEANSHFRGGLAPFELDDKKLAHLRAHCSFADFAAISAKPYDQRNTFEQAILHSVHTIGRSVVATSVDQAFLGCAIALERLLIPNGEEATTDRFAERLAFLLSTDQEDRLAIAKTAKRLYGIRSQIVHAGRTDVTEDDWRLIESYAISSNIKAVALRNKCAAHEQFRDYLNRLKFQ